MRFMHVLAASLAPMLTLATAANAVAAAPATRPAAQREWGTAKAGAQLSLAIKGTVRAGGAFRVQLALRNLGAAPVTLAPPRKAFGWLLLVYAGDNAWVTGKVRPAAEADDWPAALPGGKTVTLPPADLAKADVFSYERRRQVYTAFLKPDSGVSLPAADGKLGAKLAPGKAKARFMLYVPRGDERPLLLASNDVMVEIAPPLWDGLTEAEQKAFAARLIRQFDRDAWSAMAAHSAAVEAGEGILPYLIEALRSPKRPGHSRQWIATAIAKIHCPRAVAELVRMLDGRHGDVRQIVAYYGPAQRSATLDEAILAKAVAAGGRGVTARALVGFLIFRKRVPEKLLAVSFDSPDPKVRATVAAALKGQASDFNLARLTGLLGDDNEQVRAAAAKALAAMNRPSDAQVAALVRALQAPGDYARKNIAAALCRLTGRDAPYDPDAPPAARRKVVEAWKAWLTERR